MISPFWFALVTDADTSFTAGMRRMDMDIFSFTLSHGEGDFPTLKITVRNPRRGLLNTAFRWCWLVYNHNGTDVPMFYGMLQGLPNDMQAEKLELTFVARSKSWLRLKQYAAELLKSGDGYDPVFVDVTRRDDPDAMLDGYSVSWHYDRLPSGSPADLQVSLSDLIVPEDGWEVFNPGDGLYYSVKQKIGRQPLVTSKTYMTVSWTQRSAGTVTVVSGSSVRCWTGGSLINDWPKPGTKLDGGYTVAASSAWGNGAQFGAPLPHQYKWENRAKTHHIGDAMSTDASWTTFPCGGDLRIFNYNAQAGLVQAGGVLFPDLYGDSSDGLGSISENTTGEQEPVNIPLHVSYSQQLVCEWIVQLTMSVDYVAARPRTERLEFFMQADVQPVLSLPSVSDQTETTTLPGADVGTPIPNTLSWFTLQKTGSVQRGQVVKSTPEFIGQPLYAISVGADNAAVGSTEPSWTDIIGALITDGGVTWAMLGPSLPSDYGDWQSVSNSEIVAGTIIKAQYYLPAPVDIVGVPLTAPAAGFTSLQMCTTAGETQLYSDSTHTGVADVSPFWPEPRFSTTPGATTADGTAVWTCIGDGSPVMDLPLGLNPAERAFFTTARGQRAITYGLNVARAKHRFRARVASATWECPFERALTLSCRKGATVYDNRLPGGQHSGKITAYTISCDLAAGVFKGSVTAEGAIGNGGSPVIVSGDPTYCDTDYDGGTYQQVTSRMVPGSANSDIGYSVPQSSPDDDGLSFPITDANQITVKSEFITGQPPGAPRFNANSFYVWNQQTLNPVTGVPTGTLTTWLRIPNGYTPVEIPVDVKNVFGYTIGSGSAVIFYPVTQYYLELLPLDRSFSKEYNLTLTPLSIEKQVDTEAASSP